MRINESRYWAQERETHTENMSASILNTLLWHRQSFTIVLVTFVIGNQPSARRIFIRNMLGLRLYIDCVFIWINVCVCECDDSFMCVCVYVFEWILKLFVCVLAIIACIVYNTPIELNHIQQTSCNCHKVYSTPSVCCMWSRERVETSLLFVSVFHLHLSRLSRSRASSNQMLYINI